MVMLRMVVGEDDGDCRKCWSACGGGGGGRRAGRLAVLVVVVMATSSTMAMVLHCKITERCLRLCR